jgi:hypothetical protein
MTLSVRIYGPYRRRLIDTLSREISRLVTGLTVRIAKMDGDETGLVTLEFEGEDEEFFANVLVKEYGAVPTLQNLTIGTSYPGWLADVGKVGYGVYVDIGIRLPQRVDGLVPLFRIRSQFNMQKESARAIASALVLVDDLPVHVVVTAFDRTALTVEAEFAETMLRRVDDWVSDDHERLIVLGSSREMIDHSLSKSGHIEDIVMVEQLGKFEHSLVCKRSTRASGILAAIGPHLRGVPMHLFIPREVQGRTHAET